MHDALPILSSDAAEGLRGRRVLVTGATGFVGQHIVRQGLAAGVEIHTLGRRPGPLGSMHHLADLTDANRTRAVVRELAPEVLINLASPGVAFGTATFLEILTTLVIGVEALLSACVSLEVPPRIVHVGTGLEYANQDRTIVEHDPLIPSGSRYGAAKAAASATVGSFADVLSILLLRPFNIYGAGDTAPRIGSYLVEQSLAGQPVDVSACEQRRDFLHVDDFGRCLWLAAARQPSTPGIEILNVGSGNPLPLRAYIEGIANALADMDHSLDVRFGARPYRPGEPMLSAPDTSRLHAHMAWRPQIDLAQGTANFVRWSLAQ